MRLSYSSCFNIRTWATPILVQRFYLRQYVCMLMPILRQLSATLTPSSTCFNANAICSSVYFDDLKTTNLASLNPISLP